MRRDAVAAGPAAAGASPPIAAPVLPADAVVIDIEGAGCRICLLGPEDGGSAGPGSEVIRLGCGCKDELGAAHRQCAEAWFRIKGDRGLKFPADILAAAQGNSDFLSGSSTLSMEPGEKLPIAISKFDHELRRCEICGSDAKSITGMEVKKFMEQWHGRRVANIQTTEERQSHCWRQQPFCNFLLASLLIVFMLPWFLRVNLF